MPRTRDSQSAILSLDLLRAAAAFLVFFGHVRGASFVEFGALPPEHKTLATAIMFGITRLGHEAVLVFFVLSGFLVGGQIIRHLEDGRFDVRAYAVERCTRIFLPLVPACLVTIGVGTFVFGREPAWVQAILNMLGLNGLLVDTMLGNAPLWTLAYEIWFYVLAGAVGYLLSSRRYSITAFLVVCCCAWVFSVLAARYALFWYLGALSVLLLDHPRRGKFAVIGLVAFVAGIIGYQLGSESKSFASVTYLPSQIAEALICIGVSLALPALCTEKANAALCFIRKPVLYLSSMSYSLYLVHYPLNGALDLYLPKSGDLSWYAIGAFAVRLVILLVAVRIFYLAFEANTLAVRGYFKRRLGFSGARH